MKRIMAFAAPQLWVSGNTNHWLMTVGVLLIFIASVDSANAQSRDRANPTRLTSNEISGPIGDNLGDSYYYSFEAGPGEVTITLNLETARTGSVSTNEVEVELFNETGRKISSMYAYAARSRMTDGNRSANAQKVKHVPFSRRQQVLLRIFINDKNSAGGKYQVQLGGAVAVSKDTPSVSFQEQFDKLENTKIKIPECLPKEGKLVLLMKDGTKQIIDLSQAEGVMLEP